MQILLLGLEVFPVSLVLTLMLTQIILPRLVRAHAGQMILEIGPSWHKSKEGTPTMGGIAPIFAVILTTSLFALVLRRQTHEDLSPWLLTLLFALANASVGIIDDLTKLRHAQNRGLSPLQKLILQSAIAAAYLALLRIYGICQTTVELPFSGRPLQMGFFWYPFFFLVILWFVNCANLTDGIDGLASGLSSVALLVFGFLFMQKELWTYSMLAFATFGVLVPFFYYNVFGSAERARKIFMGDTGSLTLGYVLSFLAIKYSQYNPDVTPYTEGAFVIAFSTLIVPAFDVIRVVMVRVRSGKSPFEPDKNHIHHKFLAMGFTPRKAMITILLISCAFSAVNILLVPVIDNTVMLLADIAVWVGLNLWFDRVRDKKQK